MFASYNTDTNIRVTDACGEHCANRLSYVECAEGNCDVGTMCTNRIIENRSRPTVEVFETDNRGYGLRTTTLVTRGTCIIEYIGEYVPMKIHKESITQDTPVYGMETGTGFVIDATRYGNYSRFINHSCQPNAIAEKWYVNKTPRVIIIAKRDLRPNEEITFDYGLVNASNKSFSCLCQSNACRGSI